MTEHDIGSVSTDDSGHDWMPVAASDGLRLASQDQPFVMASAEGCLACHGVADRVAVPHARDLAGAAAAFFGRGVEDGQGLLVGALPFDLDGPATLFQPVEVRRGADMPVALPAGAPRSGKPWSITAVPSIDGFKRNVAAALEAIGSDDALRKVVLSRSLRVKTDEPLDIAAIVMELRKDPSITAFAVPLDDTAGRTLVGGTPELLLEKRGRRVLSGPLAGSARRHTDAAADRRAADRRAADDLLRSDKDHREHAAVVEAILDGLAPYCRALTAGEPELVSTASMWHLGTRIEGEVSDRDVSSLELVTAIHPTPAVCGLPQRRAREVIARLEPFERGFYAGAVGWCDATGDGRWMLAIRCAEIAGDAATLYAGCGIVAGSEPEAEAAETSAKFRALLRALGIDEQGFPDMEALA